MREEHEYEAFVNNLRERFPEMYDNVYCGIYVGQGWYRIVEQTSAAIYNHCKWQIKNKRMTQFPNVAQIKEKFGGLRFYVDNADEFCYGAIALAEIVAANTCEVCGNIGKLRQGGWLSTLCDKHESER